MAEIRIPYPQGLVTHQGVITEIILRQPTYADYMALGDIATLAKMPDDTIFQVENTEVIAAYIERLVVVPQQALLLNGGDLSLARAVTDAVRGFFRVGGSATAPSPTLPTTSSSSASPDASPPTPSDG